MRRSILGLILLIAPAARADEPPLAEYFRVETARLSAKPLGGIDSADAWKAARPRLQRQLLEMLGLDPLPEKTDLKAEVRGTVDQPDFVIERLLFQSRPGLYVTANLYRPKVVKEPLPAILYVCGHSDVRKDGLILGCKAHYRHHPAWYAANGYVCLIVDTLQLGELPGLHHGTYREGMWWWQSRGYTPAGVEAWNGVRAIDYLLTRPEVDPRRIGVTGRSGGGATTWWLAAIDDRVAAACPVAGITDLKNHVVDGVVDGHCDCMYPVNTYRWDFPLLAALAAPKPLLVENTDKDPIFPEDGVRRVYAQLEKVYGWYDAADRLGLVIGKGGHVDSEEIRHPSFAFFERWLKGKPTATITEPDRKPPIEVLRVLNPGEVPPDNKNDVIQETFVPVAEAPPVPKTAAEWEALRDRWMADVRSRVFGGWPTDEEAGPIDMKRDVDVRREGIRLSGYDFTSQPGVRLRIWVFSPPTEPGDHDRPAVSLRVADDNWRVSVDRIVTEFLNADARPGPWFDVLKKQIVEGRLVTALLAPRGVGPTAWPADRDKSTRRRFALLGQTVDGMRVWDIRRAVAALRSLDGLGEASIGLSGMGDSAPLSLWAAAFDRSADPVTLLGLPATIRDSPAFLNADRVLGIPRALALIYPRHLSVSTSEPAVTRWAQQLADKLQFGRPWPSVMEVTVPPPDR